MKTTATSLTIALALFLAGTATSAAWFWRSDIPVGVAMESGLEGREWKCSRYEPDLPDFAAFIKSMPDPVEWSGSPVVITALSSGELPAEFADIMNDLQNHPPSMPTKAFVGGKMLTSDGALHFKCRSTFSETATFALTHEQMLELSSFPYTETFYADRLPDHAVLVDEPCG